MIGHELGGRYEIMERIGGGGMALVYKANDILLNRKVAVKVLRQQFVHDEEFVRRFRREAQSAASLSHPNVVSVYDVGQEEEIHYIVMEYVEGKNLNEIIQERAPLQAEEAIHIAIQICDALEHAHQNQIIHRDIKPHNILLGKNGRVKVTDFGIARAVTSSTITHTGSVVGSVHYFSPEHAKGISTGEKSDLYSLGIVIYQMLTGRLPFLGESPISVALKHLQEDFEEPRAVNPHIPQSVENIILRSMRKNPSERYESAREMLQDLESCLLPERLDEPKLTFHPDMEETKVMPAIRGKTSAPAFATKDEAAETEPEEPEWRDEPERRRRWVKPLVTVVVTLLVIALLYFGTRWVLNMFDTEEVDVPYVVGMTLDDARQELELKGLKVEEPVVREEKADIPADTVFEQSKMNMRVKQGSYVKLYVSSGPKLETMPNYAGRAYADAVEELVALGMDEERIDKEEVFDDAEAGTIIAQSIPPEQPFNPLADEAHFTVSKGPETFDMPNLIGMTQEEALNKLQETGLVAGPDSGIVQKPSYAPQGQVIDQFPYKAGDAVAKGGEVTITVSSGLPDEALKYTFNILISPAVAGQSSEIRIEYDDATGENIKWGSRTISETESFAVEVVLAPNTEAIVTVYRDGQFTDSFPITYDQARSGGVPDQGTIPGMAEEQPPDLSTEGGEQDDGGENRAADGDNGGDGNGDAAQSDSEDGDERDDE